MDEKSVKKLLYDVKSGNVDIDEALRMLKTLPFEEIECATIDHHRHIRKGFPEVIFGEGKTPEQIIAISEAILDKGHNILITRVDSEKAERIHTIFPQFEYDRSARAITCIQSEIVEEGRGTILIITAGTSDIPVADEAMLTAHLMGNKVDKLYDVGISGIHRLLSKIDKLMAASVLIVVAGMEGALPGVVSGLVSKPVIAVPTSVGYGANLLGFTPLFAMLNACSAGIAVVNIDNGFGAGYIASLINKS
ncbi:MAG: nickel pincer cofactor biosynthesis protein LarB [Thermodesulfobacteriota bacterium]|nr:nickel pincer cofactor biosynthesis protein LarB [Thermodesulfobacteriota bacterium]